MLHIENNLGELLPRKNLPRSPLQYPGGKSKAIRQILACIPWEVEKIISPFVGGAWVELSTASVGVKTKCYDGYPLLVDFWKEVIDNAEGVAKAAMEFLPISVDDFKALKKTVYKTQYQKAVQFYVLNRASFSGRGMSGSMAKKQKGFKESNVNFLSKFKVDNFSVDLQDFRDTINNNTEDTFMFLDPPYALGNNSEYYGKDGSLHKGFPHEELRDLLTNKLNWIMTYNNSDYIGNLYRDFIRAEPEQWAYGMFPGAEKSREVFIFSKDYQGLLLK